MKKRNSKRAKIAGIDYGIPGAAASWSIEQAIDHLNLKVRFTDDELIKWRKAVQNILDIKGNCRVCKEDLWRGLKR